MVVEVKLHVILISTIDGNGWSAARPLARLFPFANVTEKLHFMINAIPLCNVLGIAH
jgi:hypothetical protein